jgi:hypothetical protein
MPLMQTISPAQSVSSARTRWQTSLPLMSGSMMSSTTRSGRNSLTACSAEAVVRDLDVETAVAGERVAHQFDQFLVVIDDRQLPLAAFEASIGSDCPA